MTWWVAFSEFVQGLWFALGPTIGLVVGAIWQRKHAIKDRDHAEKLAQRSFHREYLKEGLSEVQATMAKLAANPHDQVSWAIRGKLDDSMDAYEIGVRLQSELELLTSDSVAVAATALNTAAQAASLAVAENPSNNGTISDERKETAKKQGRAHANFMRECKAYLDELRQEILRSE